MALGEGPRKGFQGATGKCQLSCEKSKLATQATGAGPERRLSRLTAALRPFQCDCNLEYLLVLEREAEGLMCF